MDLAALFTPSQAERTAHINPLAENGSLWLIGPGEDGP